MKRIKLKKRKNKLRFRKKLVLTSTLVLLFVLGIGYSLLSVDLNIFGDITVRKHYGNTLYEVLEKEAAIGTYAKEYTGEHHDSFTAEPSEKIYHWFAPSTSAGNTIATEILEKNNVLFANHCWKMIRTTDTGGVKLMYNGEAENNQCLENRDGHIGYNSSTDDSLNPTYYYGTDYTYDKTNNVFSLSGTVTTGTIQIGQYTCKSTSSTGTCSTLYQVDSLNDDSTYKLLNLISNANYSQYGKLAFNGNLFSPAHEGYMYNTVYPRGYIGNGINLDNVGIYLGGGNYFSDTVDYGNIVADKYTLINPQPISTLDDYSQLVGKYVGYSQTNAYVHYIVSVHDDRASCHELKNGDLTVSMTIGDSYTDNGNGTYTLNNPRLINYVDWFNGEYSNCKYKYFCSGENSTCANIGHMTRTSAIYYISFNKQDETKFGENITYNNNNYTLTGDIKEIWDFGIESNRQLLNSHHYSCPNNSTSCSTVNYFIWDDTYLYYTELNNVNNINDALNNMLNVDSVNQINSEIKTGVDSWYRHYMTNYTNYLEDTIFCNKRDVRSKASWNPNGGNMTTFMTFNYIGNDLSCLNTTDKFSVSNNKAQLTYPVGLLSYAESYLLENSILRSSPKEYWIISPVRFGSTAYGYSIYEQGGYRSSGIANSYGVRPVISLRPGIEYISGNGSMADPYVVDMGMQRPSFSETSINDGVKTVTITYSPKCGSEYTCGYTLNDGTQVNVTTEKVDLPFSGAGIINASISDGTETLTKDHTVKFNKLYVKSDGNNTTGFGTIEKPYKTIGKAYNMAEDTTTIYVMDNITETSTVSFANDKNITLTSCTKSGSTCPTSSANTVTRGNSLTGNLFAAQNGTLTLSTITLDGNNVAADVAMINSRGTLNLNNGTTLKNANCSNDGGAIYIPGGTVNINGATITNNTAARGGGIFATRGTINLMSGTFTSNSAPSSTGGAIWTSGEFNMSGGSITNNSAKEGGGINCTYTTSTGAYCTMSLTGGSITYNHSYGTSSSDANGGAILINSYNSMVPQVTINGTTISYNSASHASGFAGGGAIYNRGNLTIQSGTFEYNEARTGGGAIQNAYLLTINNVTMNHNTAGYGGAIHNTYGNTILSTEPATPGKLVINGGTYTNNTATAANGYEGFGGAISNISGASIDFKGGSITGNSAINGGGIGIASSTVPFEYLISNTKYGKIKISGGSINNNTASSNGGGIYINSNPTHQHEVTISNTATVNGNTCSVYGGGVYLSSDSKLSVTGGSISNNSASSGGGIYKVGTYSKSGSPTCTNNGQSGLSSACVWTAN